MARVGRAGSGGLPVLRLVGVHREALRKSVGCRH